MRLLLLFAVVIAVIVLLWGSWQWGRRAFLITVVAVVTGLSALLYGMFQESANDQVLLAPEGLELAVSDIRESESGVRLSGSLTNAGELDLAAVDVQIQALACPTAGECRVVYQEQHPDRSSASRREAAIKKLSRQQKLNLIGNPSDHV